MPLHGTPEATYGSRCGEATRAEESCDCETVIGPIFATVCIFRNTAAAFCMEIRWGGFGWDSRMGKSQSMRMKSSTSILRRTVFPAVKCLQSRETGQENFWIGSEGGLSRFNHGHFVTLTKKNGLPGNSVSGIVEDDEGFFWLAGALAILRVSSQELEKALLSPSYRMQGASFDATDGLRGLPRQREPFPTAVRSTDGRLWFFHKRGRCRDQPTARQVGSPADCQNIVTSLWNHACADRRTSNQ